MEESWEPAYPLRSPEVGCCVAVTGALVKARSRMDVGVGATAGYRRTPPMGIERRMAKMRRKSGFYVPGSA